MTTSCARSRASSFAALAFTLEGASVAVVEIPESDVQETARLIEQNGGRALALVCDVTREADVKAALDQTVEAYTADPRWRCEIGSSTPTGCSSA